MAIGRIVHISSIILTVISHIVQYWQCCSIRSISRISVSAYGYLLSAMQHTGRWRIDRTVQQPLPNTFSMLDSNLLSMRNGT